MRFNAVFGALLTSAVFFSSTAIAETPNINPGLWQHKTSMSLQGPMNMPPQVSTDKECITQTDIDKGIDFIDLPSGCNMTQVNIRRDSMDYGMQCDMQGLRADFTGTMRFNGHQMDGSMSSHVDTPMGKMTMQMETEAHRIGDC